MSLRNKIIFITGASRGIGRAIALRCAQDGAKLVLAAKTAEPKPKLPGTIFSVADEVCAAGGEALALQLDVRDDLAIAQAIERTVEYFGGIDILVNNASAISLTPTTATPMKRYDLMMNVNVRATYACAQACIPHLANSENPHILTLSPPLNMQAKWFKDHLAYTMSKYGMSMCTLGLAEELRNIGIAVNSLWPKTIIATAAIAVNFPEQLMQATRKPEIMADAAYFVLNSDSRNSTGNFFIDEQVLREHGITDLASYAVNPKVPLYPDLFLDELSQPE